MEPEALQITIEKMTEQDLSRVLQIENDSFPTPFSENLFRGELRFALAHPYVARAGGEVVGYVDYWIVGSEAHVITLAVKSSWRKHSVGRALVEWMMQDVRQRKVEMLSLDVRPSNTAALQLYKGFGFTQTGIRKKYYRDNDEDALILTKTL